MSVADRWHSSRARNCERCKEHGMIPSTVHGQGDRWQVRWRDENGVQKKKNFALRQGKDPEKHADAFDAKIKVSLDDGSYIDPSDAGGTFQAYAEEWRKTRTHDEVTAILVERQLRLHVYPDPAHPGRTPSGGIPLGHRTWRDLGKRPSITQAWIAGMKLAAGSKIQVIRTVSSIFIAAIDDGLIGRNPTQAKSVQRPKPAPKKAMPWAADRVRALSDSLPGRFAVLPYLGAGTGMRQGEMLGLAVDAIAFLGRNPQISVCRQVRMVGTRLCFAPVKNDRVHDVPLPEDLAVMLSEHLRLYPPTAVTLPWETSAGEPVTFSLVFTDGRGKAVNRNIFNRDAWKPALAAAGVIPPRQPGKRNWPAAPDDGTHALRHTAASAWLSRGVDITAVASWLGDTVATVYTYYAHLMPDADERGRAAMAAFFAELAGRNCALPVPQAR
jgi:integrase